MHGVWGGTGGGMPSMLSLCSYTTRHHHSLAAPAVLTTAATAPTGTWVLGPAAV